MVKRWLIGAAIVVCLFIITNPSLNAFKEYTGRKAGLTRKYNFFVCSVYSDGEEYMGVLGNFFLFKHLSKPQVYSQQNSSDSTCPDCIDLFGKSNTSNKRNKPKDTDINKALNDYMKEIQRDTVNHRKSHK